MDNLKFAWQMLKQTGFQIYICLYAVVLSSAGKEIKLQVC